MRTLKIKLADYSRASGLSETISEIIDSHRDLQGNGTSTIVDSILRSITNHDKDYNIIKYAFEITEALHLQSKMGPHARGSMQNYYTLKPDDYQRLEELLTPEDIGNLIETDILRETISWQSYYVHLMLERGLYDVTISSIETIIKQNYSKHSKLEIIKMTHNFIMSIFSIHFWDDECPNQSRLNQDMSKILDIVEYPRLMNLEELPLRCEVTHITMSLYDIYEARLKDNGFYEGLSSPSLQIPEDIIELDMVEIMLSSINS